MCRSRRVWRSAPRNCGPPRRVLAGDDSTHRLAIVGADGKLEWEIKVGAIHDAHLLPNGKFLLIAESEPSRIIEVDKDGAMSAGS